MFANPVTERMAAFVRGIGIDVRAEPLSEDTVLPGLDLRDGAVVIDKSRLTYPGDILHEAGHLAVTDPAERNAPRITPTLGDEIAAIAWSWAALRYLDIDPAIVFHAGGYHSGGKAFIENFSTGHTVGVPLLQFYGMTVEEKFAAERGVEPYPHMLRWIR